MYLTNKLGIKMEEELMKIVWAKIANVLRFIFQFKLKLFFVHVCQD